ncbi:MAG: DNA/RNA nuclease SfsA [Candidatus Electrothrix sp. Rat3]|nr:DNA/RNA nuclease SfsA [Candidatus Electrothrix rattekaaiensis]
MLLPPIRQHGTLLRRYKRFLADVALADGTELTVHCPNSGAMRGCSAPGSPVVISKSDNPQRKYAWTLEMVQENGVWIGVNTGMTNKLVHEALVNRVIAEFGPITSIQPEVKVSDKSRLDFLLQTEEGPVYVEVKNCSLVEEGKAMFPDAVTARGTKHLHELVRLLDRDKGIRAAVLFCVQRADGQCFAPARHIDPVYAETLVEVQKQGVQVLAYRAEVNPEEVRIVSAMEICPEEQLGEKKGTRVNKG